MATYQQWSQSYFTDLTLEQHDVNNQWFQSMRDKLTDSGILYVPILDKEFNKLGEELWTLLQTIWKLLDKAGIETTKDAELQIEVYDEEED